MAHWWPLLLVALVVAGGIAAAIIFTDFGSSGNSKSTQDRDDVELLDSDDSNAGVVCKKRGHRLSDDGSECEKCPEPSKMFAVFWESQTDGCEKFMENPEAFGHITHVYWGFAEIDGKTGEVAKTFQGHDATLSRCSRAMQNKCVRQMASIGGALMRHTFVELDTPAKHKKFGESAAELVKKFNFDGIDIDDESGNSLTTGNDWLKHSTNVVGYLKEMREALDDLPREKDEPKYVVSWDEFPTSVTTECTLQSEWRRCYNPDITQYVDYVNLMIYNFPSTDDYDKILANVIPDQWAKSVPAPKLVLGGCVGKGPTQGGCASGATPTDAHLSQYASDGSSKYGGAMLWTASADYTEFENKHVILMGKAGKYGIQSRRRLFR